MDLPVLSALVEEVRERRTAVLVTVVDTKGSVPRHAGSSMLVKDDGVLSGTVGGGRGEALAIEAARKARKSGHPARIEVEMLGEAVLGPDMICGGRSHMLVDVINDGTVYAAALEAAIRGERSLLLRSLPQAGTDAPFAISPAAFDEERVQRAGATRSVNPDLAAAVLRTGQVRLEADGTAFYEGVFPEEKLLILGGGHVGLALAKLATSLDFKVSVGDDRPEFAATSRFPPGVSTLVGSYESIIEGFPLDAATYVVIMTRGHLFDLACARAAFPKKHRYLGFIGSARKTRLILEQLRLEGFEQAEVEALYAPIGVDIEAETPEEIAISILAELIAVRRNAPALAYFGEVRKKRRA